MLWTSDKMSRFTPSPIIPGSITGYPVAHCLICLKSYSSATAACTPEILETLSKQFEVFCKFMKIELPSKYHLNLSTDPFPFCEECQLTISRLHELNELLEETQKRIAVVTSTLSANIILSDNNSSSKGELKICPYDAELPGTDQCSTEEKVKFWRELIYKRYSPKLEISLLRQLSRTGNATNLSERPHEMLSIPEQDTTGFLWNNGSEIIRFEEATIEDMQFRFVKQESQDFEVVLHYEEASPGNFEFGSVKQESDSLEMVNHEEAKVKNNEFPIIKEESEGTDVEEYVRVLAGKELVQNETSATGFPIVIQPTEVKTEFGEVAERLSTDKAVKEFPALNIRLTSLSPSAKRLSCEICGAEYFSWKSELITHLQTKHPARESDVFWKTLSGKYMLNGKLSFHISHMDNEYKCSSCSFASEKLTEMKHHIKYKHSEIFICTDCGKKFSSKYNLQRHRIFHENGTLFCCDVCGKQLNLKQRLQDSKAYVHPKTADKEFPCEVCGKVFGIRSLHKWHVKGQHEIVNCNLCGEDIRRRNLLKHTGSHIQRT